MLLSKYHKSKKVVAMMGININDSTQPFTQQILSGMKTIETRETPSLNAYIGKRVGLVRTGVGPATLVGYVTIGSPIEYRTKEEFDKDFNKHQVGPDSPFYFRNFKVGYPMINPVACTPTAVDSRGIRSREVPNEV